MAIYNADSKLSDVILNDPSVIQVFNRFGIFLGVGDATFSSECKRKHIDMPLLLDIVNTYLNRNYYPQENVGQYKLLPLLSYLEKTDEYYREVLLPNIERHFSLLITKSKEEDSSSNLKLLQKFFLEVKDELLDIIDNDLTLWFPMLRESVEKGRKIRYVSSRVPYDNFTIEEKVSDLLNFFVIHLRGEYNHNLCVAVVSALTTLRKDIIQNNRIRNRILKPLCLR